MARAKPKTKAKPAARAKSIARRKTRPAAKAKAKARPRHAFTVSHLREEDFKADGLRTYAKYRDLGIKAATKGQAIAHVIRMVPPCVPEIVSKRHYHDVDFQMIYVLRGWVKTDIDGQGPVTIRQGGCWLQPPRCEHAVLDYSDDVEMLEIVFPGDFKTVELEK